MSAPAEGGRGVPSYKQLAAELETTKAKLKQVVTAAALAKKAAEVAQAEAVAEATRVAKVEAEARENERAEREKAAEAARDRARAEENERMAKESEANTVRRIAEAVARVSAIYDGKFAELRSENMVQQRAMEDQNETLRTLQEWQKSAQVLESSWTEMQKSMQVEINIGQKAQKDLHRYKTLLKFLTVHKFVKDVKLKKRLLPLHTSISKLIALILKDDDLRKRLINQQAELARWVEDAQHIERSEGIVTSLPNVVAELDGASTKANGGALANLAPLRGWMMSTNVDYLVASLIEVEHVLHTCVGTVLRYSAHFKTTSAGFFERNSGLTAYAMAVEKECRETKARAARTASQLASTLGLLARLEVKYSQVSRKLGHEDRVLAQRYLNRHGISSQAMAAGEENYSGGGGNDQLASTTGSVALLALPPGKSATASSTSSEHGDASSAAANEDLSVLSPRALNRRLATIAIASGPHPLPPSGSHIRGSSVASSRQESVTELQRAPWGSRQGLSSRQAAKQRSTDHSAEPSASPSRAHVSRPVTSPSTSEAHGIGAGRGGGGYTREAMNLATNPPPSFDQPPPPPKSVRPRRRKHQSNQQVAPGQKKHVDVYASSSSDEEFTLHAKSFTPPYSSSSIRALDWADGDSEVKVDGNYVAIDSSSTVLVPTIAQALNGSFAPTPSGSPGVGPKKKRRVKSDKKQQPEMQSQEQKENDDAPLPPPSFASTVDSSATSDEKDAAADSSSAEPKHKRQQGSHEAALSARAARRRSANASTATTAWAQKLQAAADTRAARAEMARAVAHEESVGGLAAASAQLLSSKAKMQQPSPYQDHITFGDNCRAANQPFAAHHEPSAGGTARIVPRPPASSRSHKATAQQIDHFPPARSARARSSSRERVTPSTRPSTSAAALKPSPPATRPGTSASATPKHVLHVIGGSGGNGQNNAAAAALEPLPPAGPPQARAVTARPSARPVKTAVAEEEKSAASSSSVKKNKSQPPAAEAVRPSTSAASTKPAAASAATPAPAASSSRKAKSPARTPIASAKKQPADADAVKRPSSSPKVAATAVPKSAAKRKSKAATVALQSSASTASNGIADETAATDAYGADEFDQSDTEESTAAWLAREGQSNGAATAAVASAEDADYAVDEFDAPTATTATQPAATAVAAAPSADDDYAADF